MANRLFHPERRSYIQVNNRHEVKAIATRLVKISVNDVLPQVQSDLETLLHYAIASKNMTYEQIKNLREKE